jgi:hypothetical protein
VWTVKGEKATGATGIRVCAGPISADSTIEVLNSEKEKYQDITSFCFSRKRYTVLAGKDKSVSLLAPFPSVIQRVTPLEVTCSNRAFQIKGEPILRPHPDLGVAVCKLRLSAMQPDLETRIEARAGSHSATATALSVVAPGSPIKIEIVPDDFVNQRYMWRLNELRVGAGHPSVRRYLGSTPPFTNQEEKHFRVLLAEIVAEAVCTRILSRKVAEEPDRYQEADWDAYYADYTRLMTRFLPVAHESQVKDP